ncbi:PREDICTED: mitochondrial import receptor subunit TOM70 [Nicrophorus vespilloides]|uniref:Mitochondrial import receptor subunit TOM70 n=1 Tax=Nicrophorus vespilloides TaxID=110193 RepID=A0ABM1MEI3_NICVS|nr:PREDICTED: mitochondrial import receptor subunit TOM70 [Nicrophorus vespilloides]XP_017772984.1 PREDICTED: mitochondrial import receptor subunit TOM70 [Nicrophorus vespilloides]
MGESTGSLPFPRWQIAVALGATGVVGLGYWYLRQQSTQSKRNALINNINSVSIEDVQQDPVDESPLQKAQRLKNEGNLHFKKGHYKEAIDMYNKAISECPEGSDSDLSTFYQNRAAAHEQLKEWEIVIEDCSSALKLNVKYEKALYRRAKAYEILKDWENCLDDITAVCLIQGFQNQNALQMADRALKELGKKRASDAMKTRQPQLASKQFIKTYFTSFSQDPVYKFLMKTDEPMGEGELKGFLKAKMLFATEKFDDIIAACTEEINSSESESKYIFESLSLRSAFYMLCGRQQDALDDMNTIINSNDVDEKIKINSIIKRASLYMQRGDIETSLADFQKAAELGPEIADVYHHRGQIYLLMERNNEARDDFDKAVKLNPNFAIAVVQKCYAYYRFALMSQDIELLMKVMEDFRKCTEKFNTCSEAYVLYGQVLAERQEYEQADALYVKAIELEPKNATILVHRGLLHLQWKGTVESAIDLMKQAVKLDNKCEFAYETLATVEVQRGNLVIAIDLFNNAINLARTETEMSHLYSLRDAAVSQLKVTTRLGLGQMLNKMGA